MMDQELLDQYCDQIDVNKFDLDDNFIIQINVLKSLINRKVYTLTEKQVGTIHRKFKNFCIYRKQKVYNEKKKEKDI